MRKASVSHRIRRKLRNRDSLYHPQHDKYKWLLLANIMLGTFMAVLDSTIVNVGLPKIMASFGVGLDKIEWVVTAYMLALAVMLPTSGWLADKFGYKRMYFMGLLLFTFGSLLCGLSGNEDALILARIVQGIGAGIIQPLGMAIISREFPPEKRGVAIGFWAISAAASVSFGPIIGGYLVDNFSWQLIFDVNIPVGIIALLATMVIQSEYINKKVRSFDLVGFLSVSAFLPILLFALSEGNAATNSAGWHAPYILFCFAVSAICLSIFITTELTVKEPLIDLRLFMNYNFGLSNITLMIFSIGMFGSTFLLPMYLQNSLGYSAVQAGAVFLPVGVIQGVMSPLSGMIGDKTNPKFPIILGVFGMALSFYTNSSLSFMTEHGTIMLSLYLRGFSMGIIYTSLSAISLSDIPREKLAQASGLTNTVRQLGGSLGVAILATVLTSRVSYHAQMFSQSIDSHTQIYRTTATHVSSYIQQNVGSSSATAQKLSLSVIAGQINKEAYIQGINDDFMLAAIITLVGGIPILLLRTKKKVKQEKTVHYEVAE